MPSNGTIDVDAVSHAYIIAALWIGREIGEGEDHDPRLAGLVEEARRIGDSAQALDRLNAEIAALPDNRRKEFLKTQARAFEHLLGASRNPDTPHRALVEEVYDIELGWVDESVLTEAHRELTQLLPGQGRLDERLTAWRDQYLLPAERVEPVVQVLMAGLRERTQHLAVLPEDGVEIRLVEGKPWEGACEYLGNYRSRIFVTTDPPVRANALPDLIAHEVYCGHHAEAVLKEDRLYRELGYGEVLVGVTSPQQIISEGIATNALTLLVPIVEQPTWIEEYCYRPAGLKLDPVVDVAVQQLYRPTLRRALSNAGILLHEERWPHERVAGYLREYGLLSEAEAWQNVAFGTGTLQGSHIHTYLAGWELVRGYLERSEDRLGAMRSLLTEHWTPRQLQETAASPA
jgi:hypothetical protein